jgi:hypothetical protein
MLRIPRAVVPRSHSILQEWAFEMVKKQGNGIAGLTTIRPALLSNPGRQDLALAPVRQRRDAPIRSRVSPVCPKLRFHHYKSVQWILSGGPMAEAYTPVVAHDDCRGCLVCGRTTEWFMEFARLAYRLTGLNLRDCLHWGHLFDNPKPLIVPTSNLRRCNQQTLAEVRESYFSLSQVCRPPLQKLWERDRVLLQSERFEDRLTIVSRMVELWEDGQYIGWPS